MSGIYRRGEWWWARFMVAGQEYRQPLRIAVRGPKEQRAAERASEAMKADAVAQVHHGVLPAIQWPDAVLAWHDAAHRSLGSKTVKRYLTSLAQLRPHLDGLAVRDVNEAVVRKLVSGRRRHGVTNATIRRDLTAVSRVLAHAKAEGWTDGNAAKTFERDGIPERHSPIVLPREGSIRMMVAEAPGRLADMIEFAREAGPRQAEIAAMEWDLIDRRRMAIAIPHGKGRKVNELPLTAKALAIIDRQPQRLKCPYVFWHGHGEPYRSVSSDFRRVRSQSAQKAAQSGAEFHPFRFHDLRHLFAVEFLRERRGSIYDLQQILRHGSITTTERYLTYLTPQERSAAKQGLAQFPAHDERFMAMADGI